VNVVSSDIRVMQIFAGVREIWGVKQESGCLRCWFSYLSLAIFSVSSSQGWNRPPIQFVSSYYISTISLHNAVACLP